MISAVVVIVLVAVVIWLLFTQIPLPPMVRNIIAIVVAIMLLIWLLSLMGFGTF